MQAGMRPACLGQPAADHGGGHTGTAGTLASAAAAQAGWHPGGSHTAADEWTARIPASDSGHWGGPEECHGQAACR